MKLSSRKRTNNIGFEMDISLAGDSERCIIPTDSGLMAAVTKKWVDTINSDIISTFAICTTGGRPIVLEKESATEWLNKSPT